MARPAVTHPQCPPRVADLAHRRWTLPLMAELDAALASRDPTGARFVGLMHRLGVGRESLRQTLDFAAAHGWAVRNPGHGHPLRPEFVLTPAGQGLAPACAAICRAAEDLGSREVIGRKWSLPVLRVLAEGSARYSELKAALEPCAVTDRALSLALRDLAGAGLISRRVVHDHPPGVRYVLAERAHHLGVAIARL